MAVTGRAREGEGRAGFTSSGEAVQPDAVGWAGDGQAVTTRFTDCHTGFADDDLPGVCFQVCALQRAGENS